MLAEISSFHLIIGSALALMICGLVLCWLSPNARYEILKKVFFWIGLVIAVLGLILFIIRPLIWIAKQISDATGAGGGI